MRRVLFCLGLVIAGCSGGTAIRPVQGVLDEMIAVGVAPVAVQDILEAPAVDERYETLLEEGDIHVWSLLRCSDTLSSEGYGIVVAKGDVLTAFPDIRHGRMPQACYDADSGDLWIIGGEMEGTGTQVDRPWLIRFDESGEASVVSSINPFDMQEQLRSMLGFSIKDQDITFYSNGIPLTTVTSHETEMGGFYDDPVWIGDQLTYSLSDGLKVRFTPGLCFVVGEVLLYDDRPDLEASVAMAEDGVTGSDIVVVQ